jgi:cell division protein FtsB
VGVADRVWSALASMIRLEDKVSRQSEALKSQQAKIENLTERVIRLEARLELLTSAAMMRKLERS